MKRIPLTQGYEAIVSDEDYERVVALKWYAAVAKRGYVYARRDFGGRQVGLHRFLLGEPAGLVVDHINGDRADNRVSNLREATPSQNTANRRGVRGVSLHSGGKYQAQIKLHGRSHYLGLYVTEDEARAAYLAASKRLHGEFGAAA